MGYVDGFLAFSSRTFGLQVHGTKSCFYIMNW